MNCGRDKHFRLVHNHYFLIIDTGDMGQISCLMSNAIRMRYVSQPRAIIHLYHNTSGRGRKMGLLMHSDRLGILELILH